MKTCLIYIEQGYERFAIDLLAVAKEMYGPTYHSTALFINGNDALAKGNFDKSITLNQAEIGDGDAVNTVKVMAALQKKYDFDSILIPATYFGRMLAPRLAMNLGVGLVADVTEIKRHEAKIEMVRPAFDGKILAGIVNGGQKPTMMSVRPGVFCHEDQLKKATEQQSFKIEGLLKTGIKRLKREVKPETEDIRDGKVLVSGGGGIQKDFDTIDALASRLGAMKSASRKVVDSGKANRNIQVGQSGKIVNPDLYIALGIYGALQHVAGLNKVKHLIAVNTNGNAPICSLADIVVEGDAKEFVERLIQKIDFEQSNEYGIV